MKNQYINENNSLKQQIQKLNQQIQNNKNINLNPFNNTFVRNPIYNTTNNIEDLNDKNHVKLTDYSSVWCMLKLNTINYKENEKNIILNLVSIGLSNGKIYLINLSSMKIHQMLKAPNTVYSLTQFNNNPKYLFCSTSSGFIIIYILKENKYEEIQQLRKPEELRKGEINKVITLSNGDLASADRGTITIWKQKLDEKKNKIDEFEFFKEISKEHDTCHLIEVNRNVFACAIYSDKLIKIFNNNEKDYPLIGEIKNCESHGNNSNGMAKINDRLFCSGGKYGFIYIICVEPIQLVQKIKLYDDNKFDYQKSIDFIYVSNKGFLFTSYDDNIIQYKIISDDYNNFVELKEFDVIKNRDRGSKAIITTDDGKIFYQLKDNNMIFYLTDYKTFK